LRSVTSAVCRLRRRTETHGAARAI
jgi:hypothetical protein